MNCQAGVRSLSMVRAALELARLPKSSKSAIGITLETALDHSGRITPQRAGGARRRPGAHRLDINPTRPAAAWTKRPVRVRRA